MCKRRVMAFSLLAVCAVGGTPAAAVDNDKLGAFLAGTCATCHQAEAAESAIPAIAGWDEPKFVAAMDAFRSGTRAEPIMHAIAGSLSDAEIASLARYLAQQEP